MDAGPSGQGLWVAKDWVRGPSWWGHSQAKGAFPGCTSSEDRHLPFSVSLLLFCLLWLPVVLTLRFIYRGIFWFQSFLLTLLLVRFAYLCPASACTLRGFLVRSLSAGLFLMTALISPSSFYLAHIPESPVSPFHLFLSTLITLVNLWL